MKTIFKFLDKVLYSITFFLISIFLLIFGLLFIILLSPYGIYCLIGYLCLGKKFDSCCSLAKLIKTDKESE